MTAFYVVKPIALAAMQATMGASAAFDIQSGGGGSSSDVEITTIVPIDTTKVILFSAAYVVTGSYDRERNLDVAVLSGTGVVSVPFRGWNIGQGTNPRNFLQSGAYTLLVDGVQKATATPGTGVSTGSFSLDLSTVTEGWHKFEVGNLGPNETSFPHGFYVLKGSAYVPQPRIPVVMGTYEYTQQGNSGNYNTGLNYRKFQFVWVPSTLNRRSVPLDKRLLHDRVGFTQKYDNSNLVGYQLVPLKFGDRHYPSQGQNGILNTYAIQDYFWHEFLTRRPKISLHDGPRGVGTVKFVTHMRFSKRPDGMKIYFTDGWRLGVVDESGHVRTLAGWRHKSLPPHWKNPGVGGTADTVWGANTEPQLELVGDWSSIPVDRQGFYEPWGMDWAEPTLAVNTSVPPIDAGTEPMEQPHVVGPVAYVADSHNNRVVKVQFQADLRAPGVCTELITGLGDPWAIVYDDGKLYVSERTAHRISVWNAITGAYIENLVEGPDFAGLSASRFSYLRLKPETAGTTIVGISKANPGVVQYAGPDIFEDSDTVLFTIPSGMTQLNGVSLSITGVDIAAKTFQLVGTAADTTGYSTFTSGTLTRYYRRAEVQAEDVVGPEGMDLVNGWLYYGSSAMRCIKRINIVTREIQFWLQLDKDLAKKPPLSLNDSQVYFFSWPDINSNFLNLSVSDGSFGPEGTCAIATWSVAYYGLPILMQPDNRHWEITSGVGTSGQGYSGVSYVGATAIKGGVMAYAGAEEGMCFIARRGTQDITFTGPGSAGTGRQNYLAAGYHLAHGLGGYGYFNTELPWDVNSNINKYLQYCLHVRVPTWRRGLTVLNWTALPSSSITGDADGRLAFSGAALQSTQVAETLWLGPGGGHNDNSDNSVRSIDLLADAPAVTLRLAATSLAQRTQDASYYADGRPAARHLYSSMYFSKRHNKLFTLGVRSSYGGGGFFSGKVDAFNPGTNTWDAAGTHPDILAQARYSCMDSKGDVWSLQTPGANFGSALYHWDRNTKVQQMLVDYGTPAGGPLAFDSMRNQIFSLSWGNGEDKFGTEVRAFVYRKLYSVTADAPNSAPTRQAITLNSIGGALAQFHLDKTEYGGMDYDAGIDAFLFYDGRLFDGVDRRGRVYLIKPNATTTWDISILATVGTPPHVKGAGVNNRFRYVPKLKGFLLYADGAQPLWFLPTEAL